MSIYAADALDALADITEAGAPVTFPSGAPPVYDGLTDTWGADTRTIVTGYAIQVKSDPNRFLALGLVLLNPVTLLIAASGLSMVPRPGMAFTWAGITYTCKSVEDITPDGVAILYKVIGDA